MKIQKYKVLLLGGLFLFLTTTFFAQASPRELVLQDVFVFKVSDQVYSLEDLRLLSANFMTLSCLYEDSILIKAFEKIIKLNSDQASFKIQKSETIKFTDLQKQSFRTFIDFAKLVNYMRSQKVLVKKSLVKAFYLASNELKCSKDIFLDSTTFTDAFEQIMKVELFLRSRFIPEENSKTKKDTKQAIIGAKTLIETVDKQIQEEVFW